jgi:nuclear pore complex protein Nup133
MFAVEGSVAHDAYMDKYFTQHPHPAISWVHDVGKGRYKSAAGALLEESSQATHLEEKHVSPL